MKRPLTQERLRSKFRYDPHTGLFHRRNSHKVLGKWGGDDYLRVTIDGVSYPLHHLAWLHEKGVWPTHELDHWNSAKWDNRIDNLRDVTHQVNTQNKRKANRGSAVPLLGVSKAGKKFRSMIGVDNKAQHIGVFDTPEEAHLAFVTKKRQLHEGCTL